jgi:hypothetical protein
MKTKVVILCLILSAIVTVSFTVVSVKGDESQTSTESVSTEPVGGFVAEDKL